MDTIQIVKNNYGILSHKEISEIIGCSVHSVEQIVYTHIPYENRYRRGKHPFCKRTRKYNVNDIKFSEYNIESCYWAGLLAADGHIKIKSDLLHLSLKESDVDHIESFKQWLEFEGPVGLIKTKYSYNGVDSVKYSYGVNITSVRLINDLIDKFNITRQKSLRLEPPKIHNELFIDSFIKGYIDGDGSISVDKDRTTRVTIVGTLTMMSWINKRLEQIVGRKLPIPTKIGGVWRIDFRNKISRTILKHLFNTPTPYLKRKWTDELREISFNYKKSRNIENYKRILKLRQQKISNTEIARELGVSPSAISWIIKQDQYKLLVEESAERDTGEENIEDDN